MLTFAFVTLPRLAPTGFESRTLNDSAPCFLQNLSDKAGRQNPSLRIFATRGYAHACLCLKIFWRVNGWTGTTSLRCNAGTRAKSYGRIFWLWEAHLIPNPIRKVLSTMAAHQV